MYIQNPYLEPCPQQNDFQQMLALKILVKEHQLNILDHLGCQHKKYLLHIHLALH